jgi:hypothetical protein
MSLFRLCVALVTFACFFSSSSFVLFFVYTCSFSNCQSFSVSPHVT